MEFGFSTAGQIVFGRNQAETLPGLASGLGEKYLIVTGKRKNLAEKIADGLMARACEALLFTVDHEPDTQIVASGISAARKAKCDAILAVGGGSVIDTGKAIAALVPNKGELLDYLEVIGKAKPLEKPALPMIAVPTTAGTGAEVTCNSVIASCEHKVKVSLRSQSMYPTIALVDPVLTLSLPPDVTAASGCDALSQLVEPFVSNKANPLTDALCSMGLACVRDSLLECFLHPDDLDARENMCLASLSSGIALANAKLGAVHGIAGPLGGMIAAQHGALCAALLVPVMEINLAALKKTGNAVGLYKYDEIGRILCKDQDAQAIDGIAWCTRLAARLSICGLSAIGLPESEIKTLASNAAKASSMKGNPVVLQEEEIISIIEKAM
ncbi:MAG: iron-containing alcohol dehydrogenase [Spirochaetaceae bacterium]|nr:MAG: iron-containing alcohol dehydrogenase [Spirochaetaceae bacterium]